MSDDVSLPHPEILWDQPAAAPAGQTTITQQNPDPLWDFRMILPGTARPLPIEAATPTAGPGLRLLGAFGGPAREFGVEVLGSWLEREIDPDVRLQQWIRGTSAHEMVSARPVAHRSGTIGDSLVLYSLGDRERVRRIVARKWGPRLLLVIAETRRDHYAEMADGVAVSLGSLCVVQDTLGRFAEPLTSVRGDIPVPWRAALPRSFRMLKAPDEQGGAGFVATPGERQIQGLPALHFGVFARAAASNAKEAMQMLLYRIDPDVHADLDPFRVEEARDPVQSWLSDSMALCCGWRSRVVCRVLWHNHAWIVAVAVSRDKQLDEENAALCRRALDVVCGSVVIEEPRP
jgi:hypothetical protein